MSNFLSPHRYDGADSDMSGIEIVGLVLGALPLLVSGIAKLSATLSTVDRFIRPQRELNSLRMRINTELQLFRNTTQQLLLKITNDTDVKNLLEYPSSVRWKEEEFERKLKDMLAESYSVWQQAMKDVLGAIEDIRNRLNLPGDKGTLKANEDRLDLLLRLKLGFGKSRFEDALARLSSGNGQYRTLTDQVISLSIARVRSRAQAPDYVQLRAAARSVFTTIDAGMQCLCRPKHVLCLGLKTILETQASRGDQCAIEGRGHHRIVLAVRSGLDSMSGIEYITDVDISNRDTRNANFGSGSESNTVTSSNISECLTFLTATGNFQIDPPILSSLPTTTKCPSHVVPIHNFFPDTIGQKGKLLGRARRRIALTAASSILELYATPWLQEQFFRNDIGLLRKHDGSLVDLPLLQRHMQPAQTAKKRARFADPMDMRLICNEWIYGLGIFLIELRLGQTLEQLRLPEDEVSDKALQRFSEFRTAMRLVGVITDTAGRRYGDVVRRCIRCEFDQGDYDLDDQRFCRAVFKYVVAPLAEEIRSIDGDGDDFDPNASCSTISNGRPMCF